MDHTFSKRRYIVVIMVLLLVVALLLYPFLFPSTPPKKTPSGQKEKFDAIAQKAKELQFDPQKIFAFVKEKIRLEDYRGLLRGPVGTLWSQGGSPADRANLLFALLERSSRSVRFAKSKNILVQMEEQGHWRDFNLSEENESSVETLGKSLPETIFHTIEIKIHSVGRHFEEEKKVVLKTSELAGNPLSLRYGKKEWFLEKNETLLAKGKCFLSPDEEQRLTFTHKEPGGKIHTYSRELYTHKYPEYRTLDHSSNCHVLHFSTGSISPAVYAKEKELVGKEKNFAHPSIASGYLMTLTHMRESDLLLRQMERHFQTRAYFTEPRLLVASLFYGSSPEERTYQSIDLRRNEIHVEGGTETSFSFLTTRSIYEGFLEGRILETCTGKAVVTAFDLMAGLLGKMPSLPSRRLKLYGSTLRSFLREANFASHLSFSLDPERKITFCKGKKDELEISYLSPLLQQRLTQTGEKWKLLEKKLDSRDIAAISLELEVLFGPFSNQKVSYAPKLELEESKEELFLKNSRIFWPNFIQRTPISIKKEEFTFEYQFNRLGGDIYYEVVDHWDEIKQQPQHLRINFCIDKKIMEKGRIYSNWHSYSLYSKGTLSIGLSREVYRELKAKGEVVIQYMSRSGYLSDPLKLYLCKAGEIPIYINSRPCQIKALWLAGGFVKDNPQKQNYEEVKPLSGGILEEKEKHYTINKFIILDNPRFPLTIKAGVRIQTSIPGEVTSSLDHSGIGGVKIHVGGTGSQAVSWENGHFILPILSKVFGKFKVTAEREGYEIFKKEIDFSDPNALPIRIEMKPKIPEDLFLWIGRENLKDLEKIKTPSRVQDLIQQALEENPNTLSLVPRKRISWNGTGFYGWLLFDTATGRITGVTEDGLYGASAMGGFLKKVKTGAGKTVRNVGGKMGEGGGEISEEIAKDMLKDYAEVMGPSEIPRHTVSLFSGYVASWFVYSAGRLESLLKMAEGEELSDFGHSQAMEFAKAWLKGMMGRFRYPASYLGFRNNSFEKGFMKGLAFLDKMFGSK